ncbi:DUF1704 domain-containing protein [Candidatus Saccharibacteria bacterium]|jgi:hypothetical protein|nr:DUF1704 domain-containing protein [Candidatus Saccharibacteria bacterium]
MKIEATKREYSTKTQIAKDVKELSQLKILAHIPPLNWLSGFSSIDYVEDIKPETKREKSYHERLRKAFIEAKNFKQLPLPKLRYGFAPSEIQRSIIDLADAYERVKQEKLLPEPQKSMYVEWIAHQQKLAYLISVAMSTYVAQVTVDYDALQNQLAQPQQPVLAQLFSETAAELYGQPTNELFSAVYYFTRELLKTTNDEHYVRDELLERYLYSIKRPEKTLEEILPNKRTMQLVQVRLIKYFQPILDLLPDVNSKKDFQPKEIAYYMQVVIDELELPYKARVTDSANSSISVSHDKKLISVPKKRQPIKGGRDLQQLVIHEVCVHVMRPVMGKSFNFDLFQRGTARSIAYEEGLAIAIEQGLAGKYNVRHRAVLRLLRVGLALGLDREDSVGRTFTEIYEILWRVLLVLQPSYEEKLARTVAFEETYRTFRGGDPNVPGSVHPKDIHYMQYSLNALEQLAKGEDINLLLVAKIDNSNKEQQDLVKKYLNL